MGGDLVVALGKATVDGHTLFGQNSDRPAGESQSLRRAPGRAHAPDEKIRVQYLELAQARQTYTALGSQPESCWGYTHGLNEWGLAAGCTVLRNRLRCRQPGLTGLDLVRLVLERCCTARQGVELLTELVELHGQGGFPGCRPQDEGDNTWLVADPAEAFVIEAAGEHWVYQQTLEVRAVSNVCTVHQDWDRISRGLAGQAIGQGWWPADGSKLDFAAALGQSPVGEASALRRWGRATLLLEQQNGRIDLPFIRRILSDHYEGTHFEIEPLASLRGPVPLCQHAIRPAADATASSLVAQLSDGQSQCSWAWCAFGPPCISVYLPIFLHGQLPEALVSSSQPPLSPSPNLGEGKGGGLGEGGGLWWQLHRLGEWLRNRPEPWGQVRERFAHLQARFDQEVEQFAAEANALKHQGALPDLQRQATLFMQHHLEQLASVLAEIQETENVGLPRSAPAQTRHQVVISTL